jgi:methionine synthase II (cobalamin-independent)
MPFNPECLATGIGSFPHQDVERACDLILETIPEIPIWPQLPNANFREQMEAQYCEAFPNVVIDDSKEKMYFNTGEETTTELEKFYENFMAENLDYFKISAEFSRGIYAMEKRLSADRPSSLQFFKSQVTGPVTFGLATVDENKRALYYDEVYRDIVIKGITMKARWLLEKFKALGYNQICFVDEPILTGFGSSTYVSVQRQDVVQDLNEVVEAVHAEGALVGTHCCGNTEWPILVDAGVDIISFDAFEFGDTIAYYPDQTREFLESGGVLAWGIVPTSDKIVEETADSLVARLKERITQLAKKGIDQNLIWEKCLLTPSCGTGSLSVELSEKVFYTLSEVSRSLRG